MNLTEDAAHHLVDHTHTGSDYPIASVDTLFVHVGRNRGVHPRSVSAKGIKG